MTTKEIPAAILKRLWELAEQQPDRLLFFKKVRRMSPVDCITAQTIDWRDTDASFDEVIASLRILVGLGRFLHSHLQLWLGKSCTSYNICATTYSLSLAHVEALPNSPPPHHWKVLLPKNLAV